MFAFCSPRREAKGEKKTYDDYISWFHLNISFIPLRQPSTAITPAAIYLFKASFGGSKVFSDAGCTQGSDVSDLEHKHFQEFIKGNWMRCGCGCEPCQVEPHENEQQYFSWLFREAKWHHHELNCESHFCFLYLHENFCRCTVWSLILDVFLCALRKCFFLLTGILDLTSNFAIWLFFQASRVVYRNWEAKFDARLCLENDNFHEK